MNRIRLKRIIRRVLRESTGLTRDMENVIINQYESSLMQLDGGFEVEVPNEPDIVAGAKELLQLRFGIAPEEYMEEDDGEFYILYSYGDPDDFDEELV